MYRIVDENEHFLVISKAPGIAFQNHEDEQGVYRLLTSDLNRRLYPVHRLDKLTSGLLVFAKSPQICAMLAEQFRERTVTKFYLALVAAKPKKKQGRIQGDMERARGGAWKLMRTLQNPAITLFKSYSVSPGLRAVLLKPLTGKTHQLRVAMKSLGAPIIGDTLYGGVASDRGYLHSYALGFKLQGKEFRYRDAPEQGELFVLPEIVTLLETVAEPWLLDW